MAHVFESRPKGSGLCSPTSTAPPVGLVFEQQNSLPLPSHYHHVSVSAVHYDANVVMLCGKVPRLSAWRRAPVDTLVCVCVCVCVACRPRTSVKTSNLVRSSQNSLEAYRYIDCGSNSTYAQLSRRHWHHLPSPLGSSSSPLPLSPSPASWEEPGPPVS